MTRFADWEGLDVQFNVEIGCIDVGGFTATDFRGGRLSPSDERSNQSSLRGLDSLYATVFFGGATAVFTLALVTGGRGKSGLERRLIISTGILS